MWFSRPWGVHTDRQAGWRIKSSCDDDLANGPRSLNERMGGPHRFARQTVQSGVRNCAHASCHDESCYIFEHPALALEVTPIQNLAEYHFHVQRCGLQHEGICVD